PRRGGGGGAAASGSGGGAGGTTPIRLVSSARAAELVGMTPVGRPFGSGTRGMVAVASSARAAGSTAVASSGGWPTPGPAAGIGEIGAGPTGAGLPGAAPTGEIGGGPTGELGTGAAGETGAEPLAGPSPAWPSGGESWSTAVWSGGNWNTAVSSGSGSRCRPRRPDPVGAVTVPPAPTAGCWSRRTPARSRPPPLSRGSRARRPRPPPGTAVPPESAREPHAAPPGPRSP